MINTLGRLMLCVSVSPTQLCHCHPEMLFMALRKKRACFSRGTMRTHDDVSFHYQESFSGPGVGVGEKGHCHSR